MKLRVLYAVSLVLAAALCVVLVTSGRTTSAGETPAADGWEYLIVAGGTTNLAASGNASLRKESSSAFREAFAIEQNLDKLGAKGWELVAVQGSPSDPVYYLKRRK